MPMSFLLGAAGTGLVALAFQKGGWNWLLGWLGMNYLVLAMAYSRRAWQLWGKRPDGTLPVNRIVLLCPSLLMTWLVWWCVRQGARDDACNRVNKNLIVGRRLFPDELPADVTTVVDLTAEFTEPRQIRSHPGYVNFPILDGSSRPAEEIWEMLRQLPVDGVTYIHCAQGYGRTALVAVLWLLHRGHTDSIDESLDALRAVRPRIRLNSNQRACLETLPKEAWRRRDTCSAPVPLPPLEP